MQIIISGESGCVTEIKCEKGKCRIMLALSQKETRMRITFQQINSPVILSDVRIKTSAAAEIRRNRIRWFGGLEYLEDEGAYFFLSAPEGTDRLELAFDYREIRGEREEALAESLLGVSWEKGILEDIIRTRVLKGERTSPETGHAERVENHGLRVPHAFSCRTLCRFAEKYGGRVSFRNQLLHYDLLNKDVICIYTTPGSFDKAEIVAEKFRINGQAPFFVIWEKTPAAITENRSLIPAVYLPEKIREKIDGSLKNSFYVIRNRKDVREVLKSVSRKELLPTDVSVDIIIPTWNGGEAFRNAMTLLMNQKGVPNYGVIIVDSGSSDGTPEYAEQNAYGKLKLIRIPHESFSHSHARNLGAQNSKADIVVFMTQDACPNSEQWLRRLIRPLLEDCAAVSCAELCPPYADLFFRVASFEYARYIGTADGDRKNEYNSFDDDIDYRRKASLSDVTCAVRRNIFLDFLYENDYAEDLNLGMRLLKAGHRIALLSTVQTVHYHDRAAEYYLRRNYVESRCFQKLFSEKKKPIGRTQFMYMVADTLECIQNTSVQMNAHYPDGAPQEELLEGFAELLLNVHYMRNNQRGWIPDLELDPDGLVYRLYSLAMKELANVDTFYMANPLIPQLCDYLRGPFSAFIKAAGETGADMKKEIRNCVVKRAANEFGALLSAEGELWPEMHKELSAGI